MTDWISFRHFLLGVVLYAATVGLIVAIVWLWPSTFETGSPGTLKTSSLAGDVVNLDARLLIIVLLAGALGGVLNSTYNFAVFTGNAMFDERWTWWYILNAPVGMGLGFIFYMVLRAGFLAPTGNGTAASAVNPYGFAVFAALAGMFARKTQAKLDELFDTLVKAPRPDVKSNEPAIKELIPPSKKVGDPNTKVEVKGLNFDASAKVIVGGSERTVKLTAADRLEVTLEATDLAKEGKLAMQVKNPENRGGSSKPFELPIVPQ